MRIRRPLYVCLAALLAISLIPVSASQELEYLYINANEGTASGGHAALRLGEEVFHFQHVPPGLLRVKRNDFAEFLRQYGDLENRTIYRHRVQVSADTFTLLRERFNRLLLIEDEQFERSEALGKDRLLLEVLLHDMQAGDGGRNGLQLKGLGLFLPDSWSFHAEAEQPPRGRASAALAQLAGLIESLYGSDFLPNRMSELFQRLKRLQPERYDPKSIVLSENHFLPRPYSFAEAYANQLSALAALHVLAGGLPLREGALWQSERSEFRLNEVERQRLAEYREVLEGQLIRLIGSDRPDWGYPMLLGMARLIAMDESVATGRMAFLNLADFSAQTKTPMGGGDESAYRLYQWSRSGFLEAKSRLSGGRSLDEWAYVKLERSASLLLESGDALRQGRPPRWPAIAAMPVRPAKVMLIPLDMAPRQLEASLESLNSYRRTYEALMAGLYRYDLIGRNCVTEIFRVIDEAMQEAASRSPASDNLHGEEARVRDESIRRLGGYVAGGGLDFIPFESFRAVGDHWRVSSTVERPSYRLRRLEKAKVEENSLLLALRESNVITSRFYRWNADDSAFVFFTDDAVWARPLAGGFNLAAGLAQAGLGVMTLPWDRGENLLQGTKGALMSLPELFFFNIRKGSFPGLHGPVEPSD